ncbi:MAG: glycoside hydrolase family 43 protein [Firmicutes bacterium]|nr:glycoside hydrolase family 43 protein [Bacillota bacterium]
MKKHSLRKFLALVLPSAMLLGAVGCTKEEVIDYDFTVSYDQIETANISSGVSVHDPSILKVGDTYYIYGSHMTAATSTDLLNWTKLADGYSTSNSVYGQIYSVRDEAFAYAGSNTSLIPTDDGGVHVWAPDVIYNETTGLYYMYYCTTSTWIASNLCYGVSESPEGPFEWKGALIYSGFDMDTLSATNVLDYVSEDYVQANYIKSGSYNYESCPNAIDPSVFYDEDGRMWMVYGSWSGGIFLLELDPATGECIHPEADEENNVDPYFGKRLVGGTHKSIEGPYILYTGGYYFLFVSYGSLNREGGYQIRVYRSETVDGTYVDMNGFNHSAGNNEYYGLKLSGNYYLPSQEYAYMATGHNSALEDDDGKLYIVHHTRFDNGTEYHSPRVHQFLLNQEGWPCMLPYQTQGETVSETGYDTDEIVGRYYVINQGTDISAEIAEPVILYLEKSGKVTGESVSGTWTQEKGTYYMTITIDDQTYSGVFCAMTDEAGAAVMTFSAVGSNQSVWGVKYVESAED